MATAVLTSPLDVLRTRLQSDFYRDKLAHRPPVPHNSIYRSAFRHIHETFHILYSIQHTEGWRGFFRGLGPSLTGVVPASAVKFYAYGNAKTFLNERAGLDKDSALLHLISATAASISTSTATNPIWLVKTRLQLDKADAERSGARRYKNSLDCIRQVLRQEGIRGFYRGLGVSYLGAGETALHLTLYEQLKILLNGKEGHAKRGTVMGEISSWLNVSGAAAGSKVIAVLVSYPHEVIQPAIRETFLTHAGDPDEDTTRADGQRQAQVHGHNTVLPADVEGGGTGVAVRRADGASAAGGAVGGDYARGLRGCLAAAQCAGEEGRRSVDCRRVVYIHTLLCQ